MRFAAFRCSLCGSEYGEKEVTYTCPRDGGNLDVILDYAGITRAHSPATLAVMDRSMWRYLPMLPVAEPGARGTPFGSVGWTPLYRIDRLAGSGLPSPIWLKDEGRNPTASLKDRASALVLARARETGAEVVVTASTGNAGAALAGMAAAVGHRAVIFAPQSAPAAKVAQLMVFGSEVLLIEGNYDQAFDLSIEAAREFGWYCRNTGYNPFTAEGKKTAAFEICEQFSMERRGASANEAEIWATPDAVLVSVGDGNIISGLHKGFRDLAALGWIERIPRLMGVQATGSAAIANAWKAGVETIKPVSASTIADSISVDLPRDGVRAVRAAVETGGSYLTVSDAEILAAIADLGRLGVFAEPAGAAAFAGLGIAARQGAISATDRVVVLVTGNGLKDVPSARRAVGEARVIAPTLAAVKKALGL